MKKIIKCFIKKCQNDIISVTNEPTVFCSEHDIKFSNFLDDQLISDEIVEEWKENPELYEQFIDVVTIQFIYQENEKNKKYNSKKKLNKF
ncbi:MULTISPECIES: hypothetical protein [unclassified Spiroplasma]|uniref:hypothetical protein n=1 Tax=unclassified Spiroplasma TaxID=2637901 RepID=UPI0030D3F218